MKIRVHTVTGEVVESFDDEFVEDKYETITDFISDVIMSGKWFSIDLEGTGGKAIFPTKSVLYVEVLK